MSGVRFLAGTYVSLFHRVQTGSDSRPFSCQMGSGVKRPQRECHSFLFSIEVTAWNYIFSPHIFMMRN